MNKIKIVGISVLVLSLMLALLSMTIANKNRDHISNLSFLTEQKSLVQEISKSIFYTYRNEERDVKSLDATLNRYLTNVSVEPDELRDSSIIKSLWSDFYADVIKFRNQQSVESTYNSVITAKLVNSVYHKNVMLLNAFNVLIDKNRANAHEDIELYKKLQYLLFILLILLLLYLFTQLRLVLKFIQKFSLVSKRVMKNATIQGVESIHLETRSRELTEVKNNYNEMVKKMNLSILESSNAMTHSIESLEVVAENIENFMELLHTMQESESDELFEKEDVVIDSLDGLMCLRKKLKNLQSDLNNLVTLV